MEKLVFDIEIKTKLDKAVEELEEVANATSDIAKNTSAMRKIGKASLSAIKGLANGFKGLGLAMKGTGLLLLNEAFKMLKEIVMQNQPVVDALEKGTTALGIVFNQVADFVSNLGQQIFNAFLQPQKTIDSIKEKLIGFKDYIVDKFSGVGTILTGIFSFDMDMIKSGLEEVKGDFNDFKEDATAVYEIVKDVAVSTFNTIVEESKNALKTADVLVEQRKQVELLEAGQQKLMLQYQNQAELQRQIRDDESLTFAQRQEANQELGRILDEQLAKEQNLAQKKLDLAKLELSVNADNLELQKAVISAETEIIDIEERITGQRSEQLTNTNALIKEQADAINELRTAGLSEREAELEQLNQDYQYKLELARKSGQDTEAITNQYNALVNASNEKFRKEDADNQKALDQKEKDRRKANVEALGNTIKMAGSLFEEGSIAQKGFAVASAVMDTYKAVNMALSSAPPPFSYITAGISLAMGLKNVKEIMSVDPKNPKPSSGGGGGGGGGGMGGGARASAGLNMDEVSNNIQDFAGQNAPSFNLGQSLGVFGDDSPVQAYVVQQDVQDQQEVSTQIQERATL
jgi:hypothetical protein